MSDLIRNLIAGRLNAVDADRAVVKMKRVEHVQAAYVSSLIDPFVDLVLGFLQVLFTANNASLQAPYLWGDEDLTLAKTIILDAALLENHARMQKMFADRAAWTQNARDYAAWAFDRLYSPASFKKDARFYVVEYRDEDEGVGYGVRFEVARPPTSVEGPFDTSTAAYAAEDAWRERTYVWDC